METKYADSVKVTLTKDRMSFHVSFNGSKQDFFEIFNIHDLLPEDKESFIRSHEKWNWATSGLFIPDNVILCFDGDSAGEEATTSAIEVLKEIGINPKVIRLEENLDPDEYILKYGESRFKDIFIRI